MYRPSSASNSNSSHPRRDYRVTPASSTQHLNTFFSRLSLDNQTHRPFCLKVSDIQFTQASVSEYFSDGQSLQEVTTKLMNNEIIPTVIPAIRVVKHKGKWTTLDNRRLRVFKDAFIHEINVIECSLQDEDIKQEFYAKQTNKSMAGGGLIRTSSSVSSTQHFEDGNYIFTRHTLNWTLEQIKQPITEHAFSTIPDQFYSSTQYYSSFLNLILEEARAIIHTGLQEADDATDFPALKLSLQSFKPAKNPRNPGSITFNKQQPNSNTVKANDVLFLECITHTYSVHLIALATYNKDEDASCNPKLLLKVVVDEATQASCEEAFRVNTNWQAKVLGSLVTTLRMYEACTSMPEVSWLTELLALDDALPVIEDTVLLDSDLPVSAEENAHLSKLNDSQQQAIKHFLQSNRGIQFIQGPPGTGKTTTIIALLKILSLQGKRTLVCAPSNKAVQILIERLTTECPEIAVSFAGIEDKLPDSASIQNVYIHTWGKIRINCLTAMQTILWEVLPSTQESRYLVPAWYTIVTTKLTSLKKQFNQLMHDLMRYHINLVRNQNTLATKVSGAITQYQDLAFNSLSNLTKVDYFLPKGRALLNEINNILNSIQIGLEKLLQDDSIKGLEGQLLNNSMLIFATLSVSGRRLLKEMNEVDVLIVDEAGQAVEAETLIPLTTKPKRCLLIGDIQQLPATTISPHAKKQGFDRSLMQRLITNCKCDYQMLTLQYRMHPEISAWPSRQYYGGNLQDAPAIATTRVLSALSQAPAYLSPYAFINVDSTETIGPSGFSYFNEKEVTLIHQIIMHLQQHYKIDPATQIGVITFYKKQADVLNKTLQPNFKGIRVHTVDGFQGGEADIIIMSFVRANPRGAIGFLSDFRRLNVALTRARYSLIMVGNVATLEKQPDHDLTALITDARSRGRIFEMRDLPHELIYPRKTTNSAQQTKKNPMVMEKRNVTDYKKAKKTCSFFNGQPGSCRKKENCEFKHDAELIGKNTFSEERNRTIYSDNWRQMKK